MSLASVLAESGNAMGADASIPMARARCWVNINSSAFGLHNRKFVQPLIVKALHRQSEQGLAGRVDPDRPPCVQFAQGAADGEVFSAAEQGGACMRMRGVHLQDLPIPGAFVEHRKSQIIPS